MEIRINGSEAVLKKGTSFEYVAENRLFSGLLLQAVGLDITSF